MEPQPQLKLVSTEAFDPSERGTLRDLLSLLRKICRFESYLGHQDMLTATHDAIFGWLPVERIRFIS